MHALKLEGDKIYGLYGNRLSSPPVELIITNKTLSKIKIVATGQETQTNKGGDSTAPETETDTEI